MLFNYQWDLLKKVDFDVYFPLFPIVCSGTSIINGHAITDQMKYTNAYCLFFAEYFKQYLHFSPPPVEPRLLGTRSFYAHPAYPERVLESLSKCHRYPRMLQRGALSSPVGFLKYHECKRLGASQITWCISHLPSPPSFLSTVHHGRNIPYRTIIVSFFRCAHLPVCLSHSVGKNA